MANYRLRIGFPSGYFLSAASGSYSLTGQAATLSYTGGSVVTPALSVEYVDTSGAWQRTSVVNGVTSITIDQYSAVLFDATGSRGTHPSVNTESGAYFYMGYRMRYGEALGTTWAYPETLGYSKDTDEGAPIFGRVFTTTGSKTVTLRCKDPNGVEATISMTIVVNALAAATHIPVAAGAWPTWTTNTVYTLQAGGDYSSFGTIRIDGGGGTTNQKHRIRIMKTGGGADPIISGFNPDGRNEMTAGVNRNANVVLVDIDAGGFSAGQNGYLFCGFVRGRCRGMTLDSGAGYSFSQAIKNARGSAIANNIRHPRGVILWECGEVNNASAYCIIGSAHAAIIQGVDFNVNTDHGDLAHNREHVLRLYFARSAVRYNRLRATFQIKSYLKGSALSSRFGDGWGSSTPPLWPDNDFVGDYTDAMNYLSTYGPTPAVGDGDPEYPSGYMTKNFVFSKNQYGSSGSPHPDSVSGIGPQNNSVVSAHPRGNDFCYEVPSYSSLEDNVHFDSAYLVNTENEMTGWNLGSRGNRYSLGAGSVINTTAPVPGFTKVPVALSGPYPVEATNSRPIPS